MTTFAGQWGPQPFIDRRGNAVPSTVITVYEAGTTTLAALWGDRDRAASIANPLPRGVPSGEAGLDDDANAVLFADPGRYDIVAKVNGVTVYEGQITVPRDPAEAGSGTGTVETIVEGAHVDIDATDPANPIVAVTGADFDAAGAAAAVTTALNTATTNLQAADTALAGALATHAADTTSVHGIPDTATLYRAGGVNVAIADGGTGADNVAGAQQALDLEPGVDVQAHAAQLDLLAVMAPTTKGTLAVWDGNSWEVLPPGTNGQVVSADSSQATGLKFADQTGGGGGGGVTDHGALTGLGDDDHALYALADGSRGDFDALGTAQTLVDAEEVIRGDADDALDGRVTVLEDAAEVPAFSGLHADLSDLNTSGHPEAVITTNPTGLDNVNPGSTTLADVIVDLDAAITAKGLHVNLTDTATDGHPADVIAVDDSGLANIAGDDLATVLGSIDDALTVASASGALFSRVTASQGFTSTSFTDATNMSRAVDANKVYKVDALLWMDGTTANDAKMQWVGPAGATFPWVGYKQGNGATSATGSVDQGQHQIASGQTHGLIGAGSIIAIRVAGLLHTSGTAGTFKLQLAKNANTDAGTDTNLNPDSYLELVEVA